MADVNTRLARLFLEVSGDHYPERLGYFLVVDAPRMFDLLWHAIQVGSAAQSRTVEFVGIGLVVLVNSSSKFETHLLIVPIVTRVSYLSCVDCKRSHSSTPRHAPKSALCRSTWPRATSPS